MPIDAKAGQIIGGFLGLSFTAASMAQFDVVNNDSNDGKVGFLPKSPQTGVYLETVEGNGRRVASCELDSDSKAEVPFRCNDEDSKFAFGTRRQFVDATKIKIVLAALGENISGDFVKGHFKDIEALKAKLESKPANK